MERVVNTGIKQIRQGGAEGFILEIAKMLTFIQKKNLFCKTAAAHSPFLGTCYGSLKDTFLVTTQAKQLPKVSLWKRLLELTVKIIKLLLSQYLSQLVQKRCNKLDFFCTMVFIGFAKKQM